MAALALAAAGSAAGGAIGGTFLGVAASSWGYMIGSIVGSLLFGPEGTDSHGPRLKDSTYTGEVEGTDMPILWGGDRLPGKPIWIQTPPREVRKKEDVGGKGGGGSSHTTYTYYQDFAVCFGGFTGGIPRRIWFNNELVYDASGVNTETKITGLSFSWYSGDTGEIDGMIEAYVGAGNCPAYSGRCVMTISGLNLTDGFGNRLPVIEAEIQTTGVSSTGYTQHNMGLSGKPNPYNGSSQALRHPTEDKFIFIPTVNSAYYGYPIYFVDMGAQYVYKLWDGASTAVVTMSWFRDPTSLDRNAITHIIYSQLCTSSCSYATIWKVSYPRGKLVSVTSPTVGSGGANIHAESQQHYLISQRNAGTNYGYISKLTMQLDGAIRNINTDAGETGWYGSGLLSSAFTLDYWFSIFGCLNKKDSVSPIGYWKASFNIGLTPTVVKISEPIADYGLLDSENFQMPDDGAQNPPIFIEENNEVWFAYQYIGTVYPSTQFDNGLIVMDATSGEVKKMYDFVGLGFTAGSSYWGSISGVPHLHYEPTTRRIWWALSGSGDVGSIHVDTHNWNWYAASSAGNAWAISYPTRNSIWGASIDTFELNVNERKLGLLSQGTIAISEIIADICERCGLASSEYDVSALATTYVGSFVHATRHSGRSDIELLLGIASADAVQSDYKMKFKLRGGAVDVTIPEDDLGAQAVTSLPTAKDPATITLPMETEVPQVFEVQYRSSNNVYSGSIAQSFIATGSNIAKKTAQLPLALTDQQASDVVERYHQQMIDPKSFAFDLPVRYTYLEPADVVEIPKGGKNYRVRLTRTDRGANWIMQCQGIIDRVDNVVSTAVAPGVDDFIANILTQQFPNGIILDGPLMRDSDVDHPGPYITSFVYTDAFPPAVWYYSFDDSTFTEFQSQSEQPGIGRAENIPNTSIWEEWDDLSTLQVTVLNGKTLSSSTKSAILADPTINAFAYGEPGRWEYLNAATVTVVQTTPTLVYNLTNLLRGRRGTNLNIGNHQASDTVLELGTTGMFRHVMQNQQLNNNVYYRAPTGGVAVSDVVSVSFNAAGQPLKPYSPIDVEGVGHDTTEWAASTAYALNDEIVGTVSDDRRYVCTTAGTSGASEPTWNTTLGATTTDNTAVFTAYHEFDMDMSWVRRTRRGGSLGGDNTLTDGVGGPLSEDSLAYEVDIVKVSDETVLATKTGITSEAYAYSGTDQDTDGLTALGHFYFDIYQLSAVVGRGYKGRELYERGFGKFLSVALDFGPTRVMSLSDAGGTNAKELITNNATAGTYTSATAEKSLTAENFNSLKGDASGYMKCGVTLRDGILGKQKITIVMLVNGSVNSGEIDLDITQGGSQYSFRIFHGSGYRRIYCAPKSGAAAITLNGDGGETHSGRILMYAVTVDLATGIAVKEYLNGVLGGSVNYGTGSGSYASTFQGQTRNTAYNDTVGAGYDTAASNKRTTGSSGYAMTFGRMLTAAELRQLFLSALEYYNELIESKGTAVVSWVKFDLDAASTGFWTARTGLGWFNKSGQTKNRSINCGSEWSGGFAATNYYCYQEGAANTSDWFLDEMTVEMWVECRTSPTGFNYLLSFEPRDWNGTVKKGFHLVAHNTSGLTCLLGEGAASFTQVDAATANITAGNTYHVACSIHPTNGIKLYLNGTEIANNSGASISPDWTDGASGNPTTPCCFLNGYNTGAGSNATSANGFGLISRICDWVIHNEELAASEILEHYRRGEGVVV